MSTYATICGRLKYKEKADFDAALALIRDWLDEDHFKEEDNQRVTELPNVLRSLQTLEIPLGYYRNLNSVLPQLFVGGRGKVVWTSTDGQFAGGRIVNGKGELFNLTKWAEQSKMEAPDPEEDICAYLEWQSQVEREFFDNPDNQIEGINEE